MTRESMTFYADWLKAVQSLPKAMQADVLLTILEYGLNGVDTCSEGSVESAILAFVKPQIDINNQRFENGCKGGRPRKDKNQTETKRKPNGNHNNPIGFSTPFVPPISPEPPLYPPISPSTTTTTPAHTREEQFRVLDAGIDTQPPKEKSCAKKENAPTEPLPKGTYIQTERLADTLLADERWVERVATNKGHPIEEVRALVREFCTNILLTEDAKEIHDAKKHFIAWLRKRQQNNEQHTTHTQQRGVGGSMQSHLEAVRRAVAEGVATAATRQEWQ